MVQSRRARPGAQAHPTDSVDAAARDGSALVTRQRAELALLLNVFLWGATFVLVKSVLERISPVLFLALRFSLATVALVALFGWRTLRSRRRLRDRWHLRRPAFAAAGMIGIFLFLGYLCQTLGLQTTTPPKSAFITGLCVVMVPLLAALVYRIKPRISEVAGVLSATFGMGLLTLHGPIGSISRGDLLTFGGAIAFAAHIVATGHFAEQIGYEVLSVMQIGTAAVSALALFWWLETPMIEWRPMVVVTILVTALLCTALAFTIQAWAQHYTTATRTALIYALEPVVAWVTSYLLVGEGLSARGAAGAVLILTGVILVEMKPFQVGPHL
ncbi:MAG: DMT family transporter [Candidatus Solibacter sp.]